MRYVQVKYLLLLVLAFWSHLGIAKENYLIYHRQIISCEEYFLFKDNVRQALTGYKKLFDDYTKPFAKDCFTALQLSCTTTDTSLTGYFFQKAFEHGVSWTAIEASEIVQEYFERRPNYKYRIKRIYLSCRSKWQRNINTALRDAIITMKVRDDTWKSKMDYLDSTRVRKREEDYIAVVDSNTAELIRLTHRFGFLGDNILGFVETFPIPDSAEQRKRWSYNLMSYVDQLFFHQSCCYFLLQPELQKALEDGDISPSMYAVIHDWAISEILLNYPMFRRGHPQSNICKPARTDKVWYEMSPLTTPVSNGHARFIDSCRAQIGLASIAHRAKKREYEKAMKLKLFFGFHNMY